LIPGAVADDARPLPPYAATALRSPHADDADGAERQPPPPNLQRTRHSQLPLVLDLTCVGGFLTRIAL
jgi:hypothetical protein